MPLVAGSYSYLTYATGSVGKATFSNGDQQVSAKVTHTHSTPKPIVQELFKQCCEVRNPCLSYRSRRPPNILPVNRVFTVRLAELYLQSKNPIQADILCEVFASTLVRKVLHLANQAMQTAYRKLLNLHQKSGTPLSFSVSLIEHWEGNNLIFFLQGVIKQASWQYYLSAIGKSVISQHEIAARVKMVIQRFENDYRRLAWQLLDKVCDKKVDIHANPENQRSSYDSQTFYYTIDETKFVGYTLFPAQVCFQSDPLEGRNHYKGFLVNRWERIKPGDTEKAKAVQDLYRSAQHSHSVAAMYAILSRAQRLVFKILCSICRKGNIDLQFRVEILSEQDLDSLSICYYLRVLIPAAFYFNPNLKPGPFNSLSNPQVSMFRTNLMQIRRRLAAKTTIFVGGSFPRTTIIKKRNEK